MKKSVTAFFLILAVELFLLYCQLGYWQITWLGWVLFVFFILITGYLWKIILKRVFFANAQGLSLDILGWFASFVLLGLISSIFVVFYRLTPLMIWWSYLICALLSYLVYLLVQKVKINQPEILADSDIKKIMLFKTRIVLVLLYVIFWALGLYLLAVSGSSEALLSPWQAINKFYLPVFFVLSFLLGILLLSNFKTKGLLFIIILHSFLLHLYLPLSHELPWGGDVWRHIGVEEQLVAGEYILPVLFGPEATWREVINVDLPEALIMPHKYAYGSLWGISVILSQTMQTDLLAINKWLMPIVWPIILPILLFYLGKILFNSSRYGLWLAGLSVIPFSLQALGSLTLPNSLGFLVFLLALMLWLRYLQTGVKQQKWIAVGLSLLMVFGYPLYFLLIWVVIVLSWLLKRVSCIMNYVLRIGAHVGLVLISIFIIPTIELISKISFVPEKFSLVVNAKQLVGQFSGWYYASQIRPHDILSGNIFFNHTPNYAFAPSLFTDWRWFVIPVMIIVWALTFFGLVKVKKIVWSATAMLFATVLGGYIVGWFVLDGDRLFTRRLDAVLAFLVLVFFLLGIKHVSRITYHVSKFLNKVLIITFVFVLSWFATTTYASGPDMRVISVDEHNAAEYVWNNEDQKADNFCVLGDTWTLLALEGISGGKIVGGGFPIDYQFAQPERIDLLNELINEPNKDVFGIAHEQTGRERCWLVLPSDLVVPEETLEAPGLDQLEKSGKMVVLRERLKELLN
jgi:hypothetical protein